MRFIYCSADLPAKESLLRDTDSAAERLSQKLTKMNPGELGISEYSQRYLEGILSALDDVLQQYSYLLAYSLADYESGLEKCTILDHGGGCGILSLLAKELGNGTVIYNDIYDVSCHDARQIAKATGIEANEYFCGGIDELSCFLQNSAISIDAVVSNNVIEHIYNFEYFFRKLRLLSNGSLTIAFASSANIHNPRIRRALKKMHLEAEFTDREKAWGHKERDSLRGYLGLRREIISDLDPSLSTEAIEKLAEATRGLRKDDIADCVGEYQRTGVIYYRPDHPTNTCDPLTGNWCERLMDTDQITEFLTNEGFNVKILSGYYGTSKLLSKRVKRRILNDMISALKVKGLILGPYYVVYAQEKVSRRDLGVSKDSM